MASTIKIKNSSTASAVPTSSDLVQGELAVNVTDKRIFTENASGTVVELGTNPSTITVAGASTLTGATTIQGLTVGKGAGAVATNTAVGASALAANTTGARNNSFGYQSLSTNTTGTDNSAIGHNAAQLNLSGSFNTALGSLALQANSTSNQSTAVGYGALSSSTVAYNTAVGAYAGAATTTGDSNTFIGQGSGTTNTTGSTNSALGRNALNGNTTGASNTAIGYLSLGSNTTASNNTAVGYQAGYNTTTGGSNLFLGPYAGWRNTTGTYNTYVGAGTTCGFDMTTGSKNTIIGGFNGNQGDLDIRTASNYIVLSDGDGNPTLISTGIGSISANHTSAAGNSEFCLMRASVKKWFIWNDGSTDRFNITPSSFSSGVYLTNTATAWAAYSDRRIKSNIVDLEYGLATVMAMQPRRYTVTANGENSIGFIAQELKEVLPEAVVGEEVEFNDEDTPQERSAKTMGVAKDNIIPVLVKAIQELKAEFDAYKATHP